MIITNAVLTLILVVTNGWIDTGHTLVLKNGERYNVLSPVVCTQTWGLLSATCATNDAVTIALPNFVNGTNVSGIPSPLITVPLPMRGGYLLTTNL